MAALTLATLPERYAICRLEHDAPIPSWATQAGFASITRTNEELSIICAQEGVPPDVQAQRGFVALKVLGPLAFDVVGVLASLAAPLAAAEVPIVALGTYDTDYLFISDEHYARALNALEAAGHTIIA